MYFFKIINLVLIIALSSLCIKNVDSFWLNYMPKLLQASGINYFNDVDCYKIFINHFDKKNLFKELMTELIDNFWRRPQFKDYSKRIFFYKGRCYFIFDQQHEEKKCIDAQNFCSNHGKEKNASLYFYENDDEFEYLLSRLNSLNLNQTKMFRFNGIKQGVFVNASKSKFLSYLEEKYHENFYIKTDDTKKSFMIVLNENLEVNIEYQDCDRYTKYPFICKTNLTEIENKYKYSFSYKGNLYVFIDSINELKECNVAKNPCDSVSNNSELYSYTNDDDELEYTIFQLKSLYSNDSSLKEGSGNKIKFRIGFKRLKTQVENRFFSYFENQKEIDNFKSNKSGLSYQIVVNKANNANFSFNINSSSCDQYRSISYICKSIIDYCDNNTKCGDNGVCVNEVTKSNFSCKCHLFYEGEYCNKTSNKLYQIYACLAIIGFLVISVVAFSRVNYSKIFTSFYYKKQRQTDKLESKNEIPYKKMEIYSLSYLIYRNPKLLVFILVIFILCFLLLFVLPTLKVFIKKHLDYVENYNETNNGSLNYQIKIYKTYSYICRLKNNYLIENYLFIIISLPLTIFIYTWNALKIVTKCKNFKFEFDIPNNPFSKTNRLLACIISCAYVYNIVKIFGLTSDQLNFNFNQFKQFNNSDNDTLFEMLDKIFKNLDNLQSFSFNEILIDLLIRFLNVFIIGLQFYPILLCSNLKNKSKLSYFLCSLFAWFMFFYFIVSTELCSVREIDLKEIVYSIKTFATDLISERISKKIEAKLSSNSLIFFIFGFDKKKQVMKQKLNDSNLINKSNQIFKNSSLFNNNKTTTNDSITTKNFKINLDDFTLDLENVTFYGIMCLIALILTMDYFIIAINQLKKFRIFKMLFKFDHKYNYHELEYEISDTYEIDYVRSELNYTMNKLKEPFIHRISIWQYLIEKYIYKNCDYFRFSNQFLVIKSISLSMVIYLTFFFLSKSLILSSIIIALITFLIEIATDDFKEEKLKSLLELIYDSIQNNLFKASCITSIIYIIQILLSIKNYQKAVINAYKGIYKEVPNPKKFKSGKLASSSIHFSGYSIGFLLMGYFILFTVNFFLIGLIDLLLLWPIFRYDFIKYILPVVTVYILKTYLIKYLCKYFVMNRTGKTFRLKNLILYQMINHFNFFFDCFIVFLTSSMRLFYSFMFGLFFLPRLDYTTYGLNLKKMDIGFMSYCGYLHLDVSHTHPIKIAFCEILKRSIKKNQNVNENTLRVLNRWNLAYTLFKNPNLKKERKINKIVFDSYNKRLIRMT